MSGPITTPEEALEAAAKLADAEQAAWSNGAIRHQKTGRAAVAERCIVRADEADCIASAIRALASRIASPAPSPLEEIGEAAVKATLVFRARGVSDEERFAQYEAADGILSDLIDAHLARRAHDAAPDTILASGGLTAEGGA